MKGDQDGMQRRRWEEVWLEKEKDPWPILVRKEGVSKEEDKGGRRGEREREGGEFCFKSDF